jgi:tryptophan synthase alpha chain
MANSPAERLEDSLRAAAGGIKLVPYIVAGHPDARQSIDIGRRLARSGIAALELGIPYSDPLADGLIIQRAAQRSLASGTTVKDSLDLAREISAEGAAVPVLMTYVNPVLSYGPARFARDAAAAGVAGFIFPDLPVEESEPLIGPFREAGLACVFLVAPTTSDERLALIGGACSGFVYCVTVTGITGARAHLPPGLSEMVGRVRGHTSLPVAVGFGISKAEHLARLRGAVDAAIVGSAVVAEIDAGRDPLMLVNELLAACA